MLYLQSLGQFYLVPSRVNRNVRVRDRRRTIAAKKLHAIARDLPTLGERTVSVAANHDQQAREARVRIAAGPVQLQVPHVKYGEHGREPLTAWVVHMKEQSPPAGQEALEWIVLTIVPRPRVRRPLSEWIGINAGR